MTLHGRADARDMTHVAAVHVQMLHLLEMLCRQLEHLLSKCRLAPHAHIVSTAGASGTSSLKWFCLSARNPFICRERAPIINPVAKHEHRGASLIRVEPGQHRIVCAKEQARTFFIVARTFSSWIFCISSCCALRPKIVERISAHILAVSIRWLLSLERLLACSSRSEICCDPSDTPLQKGEVEARDAAGGREPWSYILMPCSLHVPKGA